MIRLLSIILCLPFLSSIALAQERTTYSPEHLAAAERVVYALGAPESLSTPMKMLLKQMRETDPEKAALLSYAAEPLFDRKFIGDHFKEFFAGQFDLETCRQIADYLEGPVGRRFVSIQVELMTTGKAPKVEFIPEEQKSMKEFEKTKAFEAFNRAMPAIEKKIGDFSKEFQVTMRERMQEKMKQNGKVIK